MCDVQNQTQGEYFLHAVCPKLKWNYGEHCTYKDKYYQDMIEESHVTDEFAEVKHTQDYEFMVSFDERYCIEFRCTNT